MCGKHVQAVSVVWDLCLKEMGTLAQPANLVYFIEVNDKVALCLYPDIAPEPCS